MPCPTCNSEQYNTPGCATCELVREYLEKNNRDWEEAVGKVMVERDDVRNERDFLYMSIQEIGKRVPKILERVKTGERYGRDMGQPAISGEFQCIGFYALEIKESVDSAFMNDRSDKTTGGLSPDVPGNAQSSGKSLNDKIVKDLDDENREYNPAFNESDQIIDIVKDTDRLSLLKKTISDVDFLLPNDVVSMMGRVHVHDGVPNNLNVEKDDNLSIRRTINRLPVVKQNIVDILSREETGHIDLIRKLDHYPRDLVEQAILELKRSLIIDGPGPWKI